MEVMSYDNLHLSMQQITLYNIGGMKMKKIYMTIILIIISAAALTGCYGGGELDYIENEIDRSYSDNTLDKIYDKMDKAYDPLNDKLDYIYGVIDSAKW